MSADIETFARAEVAERAGVDVAFVDRLVQVGILSPGDGDRFSTGDVQGGRGPRAGAGRPPSRCARRSHPAGPPVTEIVAGFDPPTAAAGTTYQYSNEAYELLAFAVEHVTGMPFGAALRAELLDPVGAKSILDQRRGVVMPKPWALPTQAFMGSYGPADLGKGGAIPNIASATHSIGGASMAGDAPSVAAWAWHLFGGDVLKAESLGQMTPTEAHPYGLGLDRFTDYANVLAYGHTGSKTGYGSILVVFPTTRTVIVVFVNNQDSVVEPIVRDLLAAVQAS